MKRITIILSILMLFATVLSARAQDTTTPFSQVITGSCLIEDIAVVGTITTSIKQTQVGEFFRIDVKEQVKGTGTGLSSGVKYQMSGRTTQRFILSSEALETFSYKSSFTLIGPGPDNNLIITYIFKQILQEIIVSDFSASCK